MSERIYKIEPTVIFGLTYHVLKRYKILYVFNWWHPIASFKDLDKAKHHLRTLQLKSNNIRTKQEA